MQTGQDRQLTEALKKGTACTGRPAGAVALIIAIALAQQLAFTRMKLCWCLRHCNSWENPTTLPCQKGCKSKCRQPTLTSHLPVFPEAQPESGAFYFTSFPSSNADMHVCVYKITKDLCRCVILLPCSVLRESGEKRCDR